MSSPRIYIQKFGFYCIFINKYFLGYKFSLVFFSLKKKTVWFKNAVVLKSISFDIFDRIIYKIEIKNTKTSFKNAKTSLFLGRKITEINRLKKILTG